MSLVFSGDTHRALMHRVPLVVPTNHLDRSDRPYEFVAIAAVFGHCHLSTIT